MKYNFTNDYSEGCHPSILEEFIKVNNGNYEGYGYDKITSEAKSIIKSLIGNDNVDIEFFSGGTQVNLVTIDALLRSHEAIISASIGHINVHEAGSVEATRHKIITCETKDGKLKPSDISKVIDTHIDEHMVLPKLVYLSNAVENGLVYTKKELIEISNICKKYDLYLFLDGARIGSALDFLEEELTLTDLADITDAFYIGGTKNGMLFGEALVISNDILKANIRFVMKQHGAILAKTWVVALQFKTLFENGLYFELSKNANAMAKLLYTNLSKLGIEMIGEFNSNQVFLRLDNSLINELALNYGFSIWEKSENNQSVIRLVTSWATTEIAVESIVEEIKNLLK